MRTSEKYPELVEEEYRKAGIEMPSPKSEMLPSERLLRFRGETYREGDVIVLCEPSDPGAKQATLLLVIYDEEFGITELFPLGFAVLRVLNPGKWTAVLETLDKLRNPMMLYDPADKPIRRKSRPGEVVYDQKV